MASRWFHLVFVLGLMLSLPAMPALAHDESIQCSMDVTIGRNKATAELRFPITDMVANDRNFIAATMPTGVNGLPPVDYSQLNHLEVAKDHAQQMVDGLRIRYDSTELKPKLLEVTVRDMVAGVSEEDITPRPMGVYRIDFVPDTPIAQPKVFGLDHKLVKQPDDGSVITVMMMVSYRQEDQAKSRFDVVDNETQWVVNCNWTDSPPPASNVAAAPAAPSSPASATTGPVANNVETGLMSANDSSNAARGYVYVALAFALALVGVAVVLFKRRPD